MKYDEEEEAMSHFEVLDVNNNNSVEEKELRKLLLESGFFSEKNVDDAVKRIIEELDVYKKGQITFDDYKQAWHRKLLSQHEQYIYRTFLMFDNNNDGYVELDELFTILGDKFTKDELREMIKETASEPDRISFQEFRKAMKED